MTIVSDEILVGVCLSELLVSMDSLPQSNIHLCHIT